MTKYIELEALKNRFAKRLVWLKKDIHDEYSLGLYDGCEYDTKLIDEIPTINAVPIEELEHLRNELYEHDLITMEGLKQLNTLIKKYTTAHEGDVNNG